MTDLHKAAEQALDALTLIDEAMPFPVAKHAITALREALAKPDVPEILYRGEMQPVGKKLRCEIRMDDSSSQAESAPKCQTCGHWTGTPCPEGGIYLAGENGRTSPLPLAAAPHPKDKP